MSKAFITGVAGPRLTADETRFLAAEQPAGLILFTRNCESPSQLRDLVASFNAAAGSSRTLILIDQEGGRVQRLRPPLARSLPAAAAFLAHHSGNVAAACRDARTVARLTADELIALGINTNCAPVLDIPVPGAHDIIGNRAYARELAAVAALGRAVSEGLMAGGVLPVMKHIPGHGRAATDSHLELPIVETGVADLERTDFAPFKALAGLPAAMTAHVVFRSIDADHPASTSAVVTQRIVRGHIGFDGLLMSDDLSMKALTGTFAARARAVFAAGSDLALHCNGDLREMREVASEVPMLAGTALARFERAVAVTEQPRQAFDLTGAEAIVERLLAVAA